MKKIVSIQKLRMDTRQTRYLASSPFLLSLPPIVPHRVQKTVPSARQVNAATGMVIDLAGMRWYICPASKKCVSMNGRQFRPKKRFTHTNPESMNTSKPTTAISCIPESSRDQDTAKPCRILLAEDNDTNRVLAHDILEFLGFAVQAVEDGEKALKAARQQPFDLILMDCQMPLLDGFEATRRIRDLEGKSGLAKTPIVALSGYPDSEGRENCLAAGMDDYLQKPFTINKLQEMIIKWIPAPEP